MEQRLTSAPWLLLIGAFVAQQATAQGLSATLSAVDHNGYHITCFGATDGQVTVTATGGTPPYNYSWSTGSTGTTVSALAAGYLKVSVTDANSTEVIKEITLTQPDEMKVELTAFKYPNDLNISCYECFNGSIDAEVFGGVAPYGYAWDDGPTIPDRSGLGALNYKVVITDANGCVTDAKEKLEQPEKATWGMGGNAGTDPQQHYIGTSDVQDVVFRVNGLEQLRLLTDGSLKVPSLASDEFGLLVADGTGRLKRFGDDEIINTPNSCPRHAGLPWTRCGNTVAPGTYFGTNNAEDLRIKTNAELRMTINSDGKVGIGTVPVGPVDGYRLYVEDGIACRDVLVKLGAWPDFVFEPNYELMPLAELRNFLFHNHHLPGIPSAAAVAESGGLEVGRMQTDLLRVVEEQALYILQLEERMKAIEVRLGTPDPVKP
jgi:hypothetical protein